MKYHIRYLWSLLEHKRYVLIEAQKLSIPWRGVLHDLSKFTPREWMPRIRAMRSDLLRGKDGIADISKVNDDLAQCWLLHYQRNRHHWQHWVVLMDNGSRVMLPIPDCDRREMLADWIAVSRRPDRLDILPWYQLNRDHLLLHSDTRRWIEKQLGL